MYKKLLLLIPFFVSSLLSAQTVKTKEMRAHDPKKYEHNYDTSSDIETTEDKVISSTAEASAQITVTITLQAVTEVTSRRGVDIATMSFLDNNRINITEDISKGEGEHLQTLLTMMNIRPKEKSLKKIQDNFEELIYLSHNDFLEKIKILTS